MRELGHLKFTHWTIPEDSLAITKGICKELRCCRANVTTQVPICYHSLQDTHPVLRQVLGFCIHARNCRLESHKAQDCALTAIVSPCSLVICLT